MFRISHLFLLLHIPYYVHVGAVIETIFSILELPPFQLVQVEGTHLDMVTIKVNT